MEPGRAIGARLARRDETALEDAYAVYGPAVLAYLRRYVGHDEAEDVLQRTFLDVWRGAGRFDPDRHFSSWLFTIAHHRAVDALRRRRHDVLDVDTVRDLIGEDGRETAQRHAEAADLRAAMARLPDHERLVLELGYFEGLTQVEIAERLGTPLGTVKSRSSRGARHLRDLLAGGQDSGSGGEGGR